MDNEMSDRLEIGRADTKLIKMTGGTIRKPLRFGPRAGDAQQRDEGCLAGRRVNADRLADGVGRAFHIEEIVGNLEGQADIPGVAPRA